MADAVEYVFIGKITRTHGVRGELKVLEGEGCSGAWRQLAEVFIGDDPSKCRPYQVTRVAGGGKFAILGLREITSMDEANCLRGKEVFVARDQLPEPEEDAFYADDLLGLAVENVAGVRLGKLVEIFDNGAHEVYVVRQGARELLLPAVEDVVQGIYPDEGRIVVNPPPGLPGLDES